MKGCIKTYKSENSTIHIRGWWDIQFLTHTYDIATHYLTLPLSPHFWLLLHPGRPVSYWPRGRWMDNFSCCWDSGEISVVNKNWRINNKINCVFPSKKKLYFSFCVLICYFWCFGRCHQWTMGIAGFFCFVFWTRSLCSPGWPQTPNSPASTPLVPSPSAGVIRWVSPCQAAPTFTLIKVTLSAHHLPCMVRNSVVLSLQHTRLISQVG